MKRHNTKKLPGSLLAVLLSCSALFPAGQAAAFGGYSVFDGTAISQLTQSVSTGQNQLLELNQMRSLLQQQSNAMGPFGSLGSLLGNSGLSSIGSQSDFYTNMQNFAFDPCAVNLCQSGSNPVGTTDIEEAREWAMKNFFAGNIIDTETERDLREVRRRGTLNAAVDAMAISTITHNDLAGAGEQADALDQIVSASQNFRGDIRANSAIALAQYKVQLQQLAVLTSMLEVSAMQTINDNPIYHELGGDTFPDAVNKDDFAANDANIRINVTPPQQGSASGAGLGGALMSSVSGTNSVSDILSSSGVDNASEVPTTVESLSENIQSGALPSMSADQVTMSAVVSDTAAVARAALTTSEAPQSLQTAMTMVQSGLTTGGQEGNTTAMMGLAQAFATSAGNSTLASALNTGSLAIENQDQVAAIAFANGVLSDLSANGVTGQYVNYIQNGIAQTESGTQEASSLVLDASAIYAALGSDANAQVADLLQADPSGATEIYFQSMLSDALSNMASYTGNTSLEALAQELSQVSDEDIASVQAVMTAVSQLSSDDSETTTSQSVFE